MTWPSRAHHRELEVHAVPDARAIMLSMRSIDRFWLMVDKSGGPDACWLWTAGRRPDGYGIVNWFGKTQKAHRLSYALSTGAIPSEACVLHRCDNPPCCNPAHLWLGTRVENVADMVAKGRNAKSDSHGAHLHKDRMVRGESHAFAKLTEENVIEMRRLRAEAGTPFKQLARMFRVTKNTVKDAVLLRSWTHV